jgi:hypothetical protein
VHSLRVLLVTVFATAVATGATTLTGLVTPASAASGSIWQVEPPSTPTLRQRFPPPPFSLACPHRDPTRPGQ